MGTKMGAMTGASTGTKSSTSTRVRSAINCGLGINQRRIRPVLQGGTQLPDVIRVVLRVTLRQDASPVNQAPQLSLRQRQVGIELDHVARYHQIGQYGQGACNELHVSNG